MASLCHNELKKVGLQWIIKNNKLLPKHGELHSFSVSYKWNIKPSMIFALFTEDAIELVSLISWTWILSTLYVVLPLFATRFDSCARGIWVAFIRACLLWIDIYWSARDISLMHLLRWNLPIYFPYICNVGFPGIFILRFTSILA